MAKETYELIQNNLFGWSFILLTLFYLLATWKEWWDMDRLKKEVKEFIFEDIEK